MEIVLTLTTLSGYAPVSSAGGETQAPNTEAKAASKSSKSEDGEKIELTIWDLRTEGAAAKMVDTIIADFMKKNPNSSIKHSVLNSNNYACCIILSSWDSSVCTVTPEIQSYSSLEHM